MHYFDRANHMYGGHAIVGGHLPLATGLAFSSKFLNEDRCTLCFGDGALNQGAFHEALNLAALWKLSVVFVCENNLFGMGTHVERATAAKELTNRAKAYDMPSMVVNGMDVRQVRTACAPCWMRCARGPIHSSLKPALIATAAIRCLTLRPIARKKNSTSIGTMIPSSASNQSSSAKASSTKRNFKKSIGKPNAWRRNL